MSRIPLSRLEKAARVDRRSSLFVYMLEHHADLSGVLVRAGRPNWKALSQEFAAAGLTDINGNPPTDAVSRHTWAKVCTLVAKEGAPMTRTGQERPGAAVATPAEDQPKPLTSGVAVPRQTWPSASPRPAYDFRPASLKPSKDED